MWMFNKSRVQCYEVKVIVYIFLDLSQGSRWQNRENIIKNLCYPECNEGSNSLTSYTQYIPKVSEVTRDIVVYDTFFQAFGKFFIGEEYRWS